MRELISGYNAPTDTVTRSMEPGAFAMNLVCIRRPIDPGSVTVADPKPLTVLIPNRALVDPWPEEFLWRSRKALGVIDVWWSMYRTPEYEPWALESRYQTADGSFFVQHVTRQLIADRRAWESYQPHMFESFLLEWQRASEAKASTALERWDEQRVVWHCPEPGCGVRLNAGGVVNDESDAQHAAEFALKHRAECAATP
jgi:hypothetical protein